MGLYLIFIKMETQNYSESKIDYVFATTISVMFFIALKGVIPIYTYVFFALIISFYYFPIRFIINRDKIKKLGVFIIVGLLLSMILIFSILYLYIPESIFVKNTILLLTFINFFTIIYGYLKLNKLLFSNFIFGFILAITFLK